MSRLRRTFTAEQKAQVVRRHLADKQPVSQLADERQVQPSLIHLWVNQLLAQAERAFERSPGNGRAEQARERRIEQLEARLVQKYEVIAELMEDNIRLHSALGYITPADRLHDLGPVIFAERDRKLEEARERRRLARQAAQGVA